MRCEHLVTPVEKGLAGRLAIHELHVRPFAMSGSCNQLTSYCRQALESERVSDQLHLWIDLTLGYQLSGQAAIDAKNVSLPIIGPDGIASSGRAQLFDKPHPPRYAQTPNLLSQKQVSGLA